MKITQMLKDNKHWIIGMAGVVIGSSIVITGEYVNGLKDGSYQALSLLQRVAPEIDVYQIFQEVEDGVRKL